MTGYHILQNKDLDREATWCRALDLKNYRLVFGLPLLLAAASWIDVIFDFFDHGGLSLVSVLLHETPTALDIYLVLLRCNWIVRKIGLV